MGIDVAAVSGYLATRYGARAYWSGMTSADKVAVVTTATGQLLLVYSDTFNSALPEHLVAAAEQALFLIQQGDALDLRAGVQAAGVTEASVVGEKYSGGAGGDIVISPYARRVMLGAASSVDGAAAYSHQLKRDDTDY